MVFLIQISKTETMTASVTVSGTTTATATALALAVCDNIQLIRPNPGSTINAGEQLDLTVALFTLAGNIFTDSSKTVGCSLSIVPGLNGLQYSSPNEWGGQFSFGDTFEGATSTIQISLSGDTVLDGSCLSNVLGSVTSFFDSLI